MYTSSLNLTPFLPQVSISEHMSAQHGYDAVEIMGHWPLYYPSTTNLLLDLQKYVPSSDLVECLFSVHFNVESTEERVKYLGSSNENRDADPEGKKKRKGKKKEGKKKKKGGMEEEEVVNAKVTGGYNDDEGAMDCSSPMAECQSFTCSISKLKLNETLTIQFISVLNINSINSEQYSNISMSPYFEIIAVAQDTVDRPLVFGPAAKMTSPTEFVAIGPDDSSGNYTWIILVSIVVGLLLLAIIVIILVCCCNFCGKRDASGEYSRVDQADPADTKV